MKDRILGWLGVNEESSQAPEIDPDRAAAALMVEIMAADNEWADEEEAQITSLLKSALGIDAMEAKALFDQARGDRAESVDLYRHTSVIDQHYNVDQKRALLERLWMVAYADGRIDRYEEHMLRKLADLIHLPHSQYIQTKLAARASIES